MSAVLAIAPLVKHFWDVVIVSQREKESDKKLSFAKKKRIFERLLLLSSARLS